MDAMQPTIIVENSGAAREAASVDVSRPRVAFGGGERPQFADETAEILRSRLAVASLVIALVLAAALVGSLAVGAAGLWWLRGLVLLIAGGAAVLLRSERQLSLAQLRKVEQLVFGAVGAQLALVLLTGLARFTALGDAVSVVSLRQQSLGAWCILIFVYGTLMPNTWRRAATVTLVAAAIPYAVIAFFRWQTPAVIPLLASEQATSPLPLTVVAALVATFGSHAINSARREAFKARQLGQYRLKERIGAGGMGEVYEGEHMLLKRPCAIKLIKPASEADASAIARFEQEVKATAGLTHWNTVEIYDYGRATDGTFYYVMELLPGMSLENLVEQYGPLPPGRVVFLVRQICGALREAHGAGLIHRDIKPANIFASQRGGQYDVAKLLDFGLVKQQAGSAGGEIAGAGSFSGTPLYMSPEQAMAYEDVDGRADIYALGTVAWYLLTGEVPFRSRNVLELLAAHRNTEVRPPSQVATAVPDDLDRIILKCMAKEPAERYADAASLEAALAGCSVADEWTFGQAADWWGENVGPTAGSISG